MKDLTQEQYLSAKPLYWSKRAGPEHNHYKQGHLMCIKYSKDKPEELNMTKWPEFYGWTQDLTYEELNDHNKACWRGLMGQQ